MLSVVFADQRHFADQAGIVAIVRRTPFEFDVGARLVFPNTQCALEFSRSAKVICVSSVELTHVSRFNQRWLRCVERQANRFLLLIVRARPYVVREEPGVLIPGPGESLSASTAIRRSDHDSFPLGLLCRMRGTSAVSVHRPSASVRWRTVGQNFLGVLSTCAPAGRMSLGRARVLRSAIQPQRDDCPLHIGRCRNCERGVQLIGQRVHQRDAQPALRAVGHADTIVHDSK